MKTLSTNEKSIVGVVIRNKIATRFLASLSSPGAKIKAIGSAKISINITNITDIIITRLIKESIYFFASSCPSPYKTLEYIGITIGWIETAIKENRLTGIVIAKV